MQPCLHLQAVTQGGAAGDAGEPHFPGFKLNCAPCNFLTSSARARLDLISATQLVLHAQVRPKIFTASSFT